MHSHVGWYLWNPTFIYSCFTRRFFLDCFKHGNAAVRLIVIYICSIFEIYIFFAVKCANMILTMSSLLMLLAKGSSMTAKVPNKQLLTQ